MAKRRKKQSVILSVTIGRRCYRHIQIPESYTLEELADIILYVFNFYNDHAHAFFMDNKAWSDTQCYYMAEVDEDDEYPHTCDYTLRQLALKEGDKFKFIFDFGDEWIFQCRVLRIIEAAEQDALLIKHVGIPPEQYPGYADSEEEE